MPPKVLLESARPERVRENRVHFHPFARFVPVHPLPDVGDFRAERQSLRRPFFGDVFEEFPRVERCVLDDHR